MILQSDRSPLQKGVHMKIRKLADAAIIAALLLTSIPDAAPAPIPDDLSHPAACTVPAADTAENPAAREPS